MVETYGTITAVPAKGRPRLTLEDYQARLKEYCARYGVKPTADGFAPFPTGRRETPQHREWIKLYKAYNRLARRGRGQCERCSAPASDRSVFCEAHRAGVAARAGLYGASVEDRRELLATQNGRCPICGQQIEVWDSVDHCHRTRRVRAVLHQRCNQLVALAEAAGPDVLQRLRAYLWSPKDRSRR